MSENFEGKKPYDQVRKDAKELLIGKGYSEQEAERRISVSLDEAKESEEKQRHILGNFENDPGPRSSVKPKQESQPITNKETERKEEAERIKATPSPDEDIIREEQKRRKGEQTPRGEETIRPKEAPSEHEAVDAGTFPERFEQFKEYFVPEATVGDEAAPLHLVQLVANRMKALETPFDVAGIRTKKQINEKLAELGLADQYKSLANESKRLKQFFADAVKMPTIDPLLIQTRFIHLRDFVEKSEALHHVFESKLGLSSMSTESRKERVSDVKESLDDVLQTMKSETPAQPAEAGRVSKESVQDDNTRRAFLDSVQSDIARAIPNAFAITTPAEYLKIGMLVKEANRILESEGKDEDESYGANDLLNELGTTHERVDKLIARINELKTDLLDEYGGNAEVKQNVPEPDTVPQTPEAKPEPVLEPEKSETEPDAEKPEAAPEPEASSETNLNAYEQSRVEWKQTREEWKDVKSKYEAALQNHYQSLQERNLLKRLWDKDGTKPAELAGLEKQYLDVRKRYINVVKQGLDERAKTRSDENKTKYTFANEKIKGAVAGRFVLDSVRRQLDLRKEAVAKNRPEVVQKVQGWFAERFTNRRENESEQQYAERIATYKNRLRKAAFVTGAVSTLGLSVMAKATRDALVAHGGTLGATIGKSPFTAAFSGAAFGAVAGGFLGNRGVEYFSTRHRRAEAGISRSEAREEINADNLARLETDVLRKESALQKSETLKKRATVTGAIAGGAAGAYIGGMDGSEVDQIADVPGTPEVPAEPPEADEIPEARPAVPNEESPPGTNDIPPYAQPTPPSSTPEPPQSAGEDLRIPRPEIETPAEDLPKFEYTPPEPTETAPHIPRPEIETPPGDLPKFEYATPEPEPIPENGSMTHVAEKGDNVWNILEGKGSDANPQGGLSEVVRDMPRAERNRALDTLMDYMEKNEEFTRSAGITSGDPDRLAVGDSVNVEMMDAKLRELLGGTELPETMEAPPVRPVVEVPAMEVPDDTMNESAESELQPEENSTSVSPADRSVEYESMEYVENPENKYAIGFNVPYEIVREVMTPQGRMVEIAALGDSSHIIYSPIPSLVDLPPGTKFIMNEGESRFEDALEILPAEIGNVKLHYIFGLLRGAEANNPGALARLESLDADVENLNEIMREFKERGGAADDLTLTLNEWLNTTREDVDHDEFDTSTPPGQSYDPFEDPNKRAREASFTPEAADATRAELVQSVEGRGGFLNDLFGNSTAGTYEKLAEVPFSELQPLMQDGAEDELDAWLSEHNISEAGFEKWMDWIDGNVERVPANLDMKVGEYVAEVINANATTA